MTEEMPGRVPATAERIETTARRSSARLFLLFLVCGMSVVALAHFVPEFTRFGIGFILAFLALAFLAALAFGYLIQRTDSLLAATLAHIGADVGIFLPVFLGITSAGRGV